MSVLPDQTVDSPTRTAPGPIGRSNGSHPTPAAWQRSSRRRDGAGPAPRESVELDSIPFAEGHASRGEVGSRHFA